MRWGYVAGGAVLVAAVVLDLRVASNRGASGGVDLALSHLPPGYTAHHGAIAFNAVTGTAHMSDLVIAHDGVTMLTAGSTDVTGIGSLTAGMPRHIGHIALHDVSYPPLLRHIDRAEADDLDTANVRAIMDPAAYPGSKPASPDRQPLLGRLELFGIVLHADPQTPQGKPVDITVVHADVAGMAARQLPSPPPPGALGQPAIQADLLRALAFRDLAAEGMVMVLPHGETFHVDNANLHGYDGGKIDSETISNLFFISPNVQGEMRVGTFALGAVDASRLLARLPDLEADPAILAAGISNLIRAGKFTLRDMKIDLGKGPRVTLDSIEAVTNYHGEDASDSTVAMRNLNVATTGRDIPPQAAQALQNFGMSDFSMDVDSAGSYDRVTGHLVAKREDIALKGLGTLHITGDVDRLHLGSGSFNPNEASANAAAIMRDARLIRADLRWDDASLTNRLFHLAELRSGQSEEALRAGIALPLATLGAFFQDQPDVADQINAFLDGRHRLEVTLAPANPVTIAEINATPVTDKAHLLGARITGN